MIDKFNLLFVTFFNLGKLKYAPGTLASIVTCLIFFLAIKIISYELLAILIVLIFSYSIISIKNTKKYFKSKDPKEIVIDEVVGQSLPLLFIPVLATFSPSTIMILSPDCMPSCSEGPPDIAEITVIVSSIILNSTPIPLKLPCISSSIFLKSFIDM